MAWLYDWRHIFFLGCIDRSGPSVSTRNAKRCQRKHIQNLSSDMLFEQNMWIFSHWYASLQWSQWRIKSPVSGLFGLLTQLFLRRRSKKTSKLRVTGLCGENGLYMYRAWITWTMFLHPKCTHWYLRQHVPNPSPYLTRPIIIIILQW